MWILYDRKAYIYAIVELYHPQLTTHANREEEIVQIRGKNVQAYLDKSNIFDKVDVLFPPLPLGFEKASIYGVATPWCMENAPVSWLLVYYCFFKAIGMGG